MDVGVHASGADNVDLVCVALGPVLDPLCRTFPECGFVDVAFVSWPSPVAGGWHCRGLGFCQLRFARQFVCDDLPVVVDVQYLPAYACCRVFGTHNLLRSFTD